MPPKKVPYFKPGKELKELINREPDGAGRAGAVGRAAEDRTRTPPASDPSSSMHLTRLSTWTIWSPWRLSYVTRHAASRDRLCVLRRAGGRSKDLARRVPRARPASSSSITVSLQQRPPDGRAEPARGIAGACDRRSCAS